MTIYGILIVSKLFYSEYIDSLFVDKDEAVAYAEELEETLDTKRFLIEVEPFYVKDSDGGFHA